MNRTLADGLLRNHFTVLFLIVALGIGLAEVSYYHIFDLEGGLPAFLDFEARAADENSWWTSERKVVWALGSLWGFLVGAKAVLKWV